MLSADKNMRNIQPTAELPLVHVPLTNAMPTRPPRGPTRNLTGIFLGSESRHAPQGVKHAVPPLARGRGMPSCRVRTPTEQRRYPEKPYSGQVQNSFQNTANTMHSFPLHHHPLLNPNIPNMPAMPMSRYPLVPRQRKVELLRIKEDKKGFVGNPLKKPNTPKSTVISPRMNYPDYQEPDFWELTKQNARHFTASTNAGVTHFEYLAPDERELDQGSLSLLDDVLAEELHQASITQKELIGIVDCYKKVCRGNVDALLNLLPQKRIAHSGSKGRQSTGFTVKSYRNPKQAEIIASFPTPQTPRPRTSATGYSHRPYVPAPYFFKSYQPHKPTDGQLLGRDINPYSDSSIIASPGAGHFSQSVTRGKQNSSASVQSQLFREKSGGRRREVLQTPLAPTSTPLASRSQADLSQTPVRQNKVDVALPHVDHTVLQKTDPEASGKDTQSSQEENTKLDQEREIRQENESMITLSNNNQEYLSESITEKLEEDKMNSEGQETEKASNADVLNTNTSGGEELEPNVMLKKQGSNSEICIELEDEAGEQKPVEIDVADEGANEEEVPETVGIPEEFEPQAGRRVSITERVLKSRNSEQQLKNLTKSAEERKKELAELLTEHAQIVHRVSSMEEVASPSADKENNTFQPDFCEQGENINDPH